MISYLYDSEGRLCDFAFDDDWDELDSVPEWVSDGSPVRMLEDAA
jgi:hypothetical protein